MEPVISPIKEEVKPQDTVVEKKPFTIDDLLHTNSTGMVTPSKKVEDIPLKETSKIEENKKKEEIKPIIHEDKIPENVNTISDDQFFDDFFDD